jgi:hypothetical protein
MKVTVLNRFLCQRFDGNEREKGAASIHIKLP